MSEMSPLFVLSTALPLLSAKLMRCLLKGVPWKLMQELKFKLCIHLMNCKALSFSCLGFFIPGFSRSSKASKSSGQNFKGFQYNRRLKSEIPPLCTHLMFVIEVYKLVWEKRITQNYLSARVSEDSFTEDSQKFKLC